MNDFKLLGGFDDGRTDERTLVVVESLLRLKIDFLVSKIESKCFRTDDSSQNFLNMIFFC